MAIARFLNIVAIGVGIWPSDQKPIAWKSTNEVEVVSPNTTPGGDKAKVGESIGNIEPLLNADGESQASSED